MPASIGVNLRVTGHCSQGGRKYMEDLFSVAYQQTEDERDLEYAFFGIYDGHGGSEAAAFAKEHLMDSIVKQRQFWSDNDEDVLKAIRNGYMLTHLNMWKELEKWPKTVTGLPSTAGTTASVAFIRRGKIYIGHVGDSAIVLGYQKDGCDDWAAKPLTLDHKPESSNEIERIQRCGGKVVSKAGVPRVVWNRPRPGHKGPIKKNTPMDEIPFLAVARSLGDLWSYNTQNDEFIVSPDPDVGVLTIDPSKYRCLVFGTDGLWNMISPEGAVSLVQATERHNEAALVGSNGNQPKDWLNPSKSLVDHALERWSNTRMRADNTSVVTLMLDPPGPPRAAVLRSRCGPAAAAPPPAAAAGLTIVTRYSDERAPPPPPPVAPPPPPCSLEPATYGDPATSYFMARLLSRTRLVNTLEAVFDEIASDAAAAAAAAAAASPTTRPPDDAPAEETRAASPEPLEPQPEPDPDAPRADADKGIQINEVSSSSPSDAPPRPRTRRPRDSIPAAHDRVLRSHDAEQRPPPTERVVILSRRAAAVPAERPRASPGGETARVTRAAAGNWARGGGGAGGTRRPRRNNENAAASPRRRRAPSAEPGVTSTTDEAPRALRSRNEPAAAPPLPSSKRARQDKPADKPASKPASKPANKRAGPPWAPALALRNRLRRRLAK